MSVNYRIRSVEVECFRCIKDLKLDLLVDAPLYLIGANNSGKSTVLNAIALALESPEFYQFKPTEYDYHHAPDGTIADKFAVRVKFAAATATELPAVQGVGNPKPVHGIATNGTTDKNGLLSHRHVLVADDNSPIVVVPNTKLKQDMKEAYKDHEGIGPQRRYARPSEIRKDLPEVWHFRPDNLSASLYKWRRGPLQKLATLLTDRFLNTNWELKHGSKKRPMPETLKSAHSFFQNAVQEFPFWKDDLRPKLETSLSTFLGRSTGMQLNPTIQAFEDWLTQQLALSFAADATGVLTPLDRMGDGWQSVVRLAALDVLRQFPDECKERIVLLVEEPETYLHPHLRRKLRDVLADLAAQGWVVVCSTHAPEFIQFSSSQKIVRLWQSKGDTLKGEIETSGLPQGAKFQEKLDEKGTHEMLFANRAVMCEGKSDTYAVEQYGRKADLDLDGRSISVVGVGRDNLASYADIATALLVPWCALTDEDRDATGTQDPSTAAVIAALQTRAGPSDLVVSWPGSLESCFGLTTGKARPDWQYQNAGRLDLAGLKSQYPEYSATAEAIKAWCEQS